jgi:DNA-binding transcriptional regulator YiaG
MAEEKRKPIKPSVPRFKPSTPEEITAGLAGLSWGKTSKTEIGRRMTAKAPEDQLPPDTPLLTRVLYHEAMEERSAAKHRAKTAETAENPQKLRKKSPSVANEPAKSAVIEEARAAIAKIPSKLTAKTAGDFKSRLKGIGMTQSEFARLTDTPLRTVESWSKAAPPANVLVMIWLLEVVPDLRAVLEARVD